MHKPVLLESVLSHLNLVSGCTVLDGTVGGGGHSEAILRLIGPSGFLLGLDQDGEALKRSEVKLNAVGGRFVLRHTNFRHLDQVLSSLNLHKVHAVLLDVGVSSDQLDDSGRGFSFRFDAPLDMRMGEDLEIKASDLLRILDEKELAQIFQTYGEERFSRQIARQIVRVRAGKPITTTFELKEAIEQSVPGKYKHGRIHPATRVFQALRIAVNDELGALKEALPKAFNALEPNGRLAVISFHSLEDRIVKRFFIEKKVSGEGRLITKKPIQPEEDEIEVNPRARSAKLRVIERG